MTRVPKFVITTQIFAPSGFRTRDSRIGRQQVHSSLPTELSKFKKYNTYNIYLPMYNNAST